MLERRCEYNEEELDNLELEYLKFQVTLICCCVPDNPWPDPKPNGMQLKEYRKFANDEGLRLDMSDMGNPWRPDLYDEDRYNRQTQFARAQHVQQAIWAALSSGPWNERGEVRTVGLCVCVNDAAVPLTAYCVHYW